MARDRGRGERKAQAKFYTRTRRLCSKGQHVTFVAFVQDVEESSNNDVTNMTADGSLMTSTFHITISRRGVTEDQEAEMMKVSQNTQKYASRIVDQAADDAGVSRLWARRLALYKPYHESLQQTTTIHEKNEEDYIESLMAAQNLLIHEIGQIEDNNIVEVKRHLDCLEHDVDEQVEVDRTLAFYASLLKLCRKEHQRCSRPITFSVSTTIGGRKRMMEKDIFGSAAGDISLVHSALASAKDDIEPPTGCEKLTITVKGSGKYSFETKASPKYAKEAREYLDSAIDCAEKAWKTAAINYKTGHTSRRTEQERHLPSPRVNIKTTTEEIERYKKNTSAEESMQPSLNIGVIGDVANGKSTLIRAITGKRTQQHSSEQQQHGITIRLGFANAAVLRCQNIDECGSYAFLHEEEDNGAADLPMCQYCNCHTRVIRRVSFLDCPGHAELMATMLSGASAFDAVILASAANLPCPTAQAKQHLDAIELSGILGSMNRNIAVAQTKAELAAAKSSSNFCELTAHASTGKRQLRKTIAANAPFFPICSLLGLGLQPLAKWIAIIELPLKKKNVPPNMKVLRSFDINVPGTESEESVGGVLGGSITGNGFINIDDELEVRPGLFVDARNTDTNNKMNVIGEDMDDKSQSFQVKPLECHVKSLMTGKTHLTKVTKGGLVAIQTTLCPSICTNNGFVGSVVGPPGSLPPIWGPTLLLEDLELVEINHGSNNKKEKSGRLKEVLKKSSVVKCHIGPAVVSAEVVRVSKSKRKLEIEVKGPVVASKGSIVAIQAKTPSNRNFSLVAHARVFGGDKCVDGSEDTGGGGDDNKEDLSIPEEDCDGLNSTVANVLDDDEHYRSMFLEELDSHNSNKMADESVSSYSTKIKVPAPQVEQDGGAHVCVTNFNQICVSLRRDPQHLMSYLEKEGNLCCFLAGGGTGEVNNGSSSSTAIRVRWRSSIGTFPSRFSSILKRYAKCYVICEQCHMAQTELLKQQDGNQTELVCRKCNARRFV